MTTLQLDGDRYADGDGFGFGEGDGYGYSDGDGYGTGIGYGESRGEGYGTGYRHHAFGDTGDGGLLLRGPEPTHDMLTTDDALEALTYL
jgi:hypothetical protein